MLFKSLIGATAFCACLSSLASARPAQGTQNLKLDERLQIPGAVLKPGTYTFSIEDTMRDRTIVRIESTDKDEHYLVLTVPNAKVLSDGARNGLIMFHSKDEKKQVLKGWTCPGCAGSLEFVYPKLEAVKIMGATGEPVLAVDPESDKLPVKLSGDDRKVVTLWLLAPKRITAEDRTPGVVAQKYEGEKNSAKPAQNEAPLPRNPMPSEAANPVPVSSVTAHSERLPKTASNTFSLALWGLLALLTAAGFEVSRLRGSRARGR